jgi:preprotein translocase subunit SecD
MKKRNLLVRFIIIAAVTLVGIYAVFGPRRVPTAQDFTWSGVKQNLADNINLGLDLRGGSHLVMRVQVEKYLQTLTENYGDAAFAAAQKAGLPVTSVQKIVEPNNKNYQFVIETSDASKQNEITDAVKKEVNLVDWTETTSGGRIAYSLPQTIQTALSQQAVNQAKQIIETRINKLGVTEPTLQTHGAASSYQLLLQMPGIEDPERAKQIIGSKASLALMKVVDPAQPFPTREAALASLGGSLPPNRAIYPIVERDDSTENNSTPPKTSGFMIVETPAVITGDELRDAQPYSQTGGDSNYEINFFLKPAGAQKFGMFTQANIGKPMAIVLNDEIKSYPTIQSQIFDNGRITGRFTRQSAEDLALTLKSGALPAPIQYQEERTVGPSLGADSIRSGVTASIAGLIFVMLFMVFYYRGSGINAIIALALNMLLTLAALIAFDATLTLPGIAGLILGIGMAVDSNVLIFERIREELKTGKAVPQAVDLGFDRAFITIIDTHVTTIISSLLLFVFGTGPIRGFAITLILGLLINLFSAVYVSRTIFIWLLSRKKQVESLSI